MRYCGHFLIKAEGGAKNTNVITLYRYPGDPLPSFSCSERVTLTLLSLSTVLHLLIGFAFGSRLLEVAASFNWKTTERIK